MEVRGTTSRGQAAQKESKHHLEINVEIINGEKCTEQNSAEIAQCRKNLAERIK